MRGSLGWAHAGVQGLQGGTCPSSPAPGIGLELLVPRTLGHSYSVTTSIHSDLHGGVMYTALTTSMNVTPPQAQARK